MFTQEEANNLIALPKLVYLGKVGQRAYLLPTQVPVQTKLDLISEDTEYQFQLDINQSKKYSVKLSIHTQESESNIGLVRLDFFGTHTNPVEITENLPLIFHEYAGKYFGTHEHHIHYFVEGYKHLSWAIPLTVDGFGIRNIENQSDVNSAIVEFSKKINIITDLKFQEALQL
jgi:hypothetical protein